MTHDPQQVEYIKLVDLLHSRHDSTTHSRAGIHDDTQYICGRGMSHSRPKAGRTLLWIWPTEQNMSSIIVTLLLSHSNVLFVLVPPRHSGI